MENDDCEKISNVMKECIKEHNGTHACKEIIEKFETLCVKNDENKENEENENSSQSKGIGSMLKKLVGIGDEGEGDEGEGDEGEGYEGESDEGESDSDESDEGDE